MAAFSLSASLNPDILSSDTAAYFIFVTSIVISLCCCATTRSLTMQTERRSLEAPVPSRRTACRHVPPYLRSTPCRSETSPPAPPCRMEQVTTYKKNTFLLSDSYLSTQNPENEAGEISCTELPHGLLPESLMWIH